MAQNVRITISIPSEMNVRVKELMESQHLKRNELFQVALGRYLFEEEGQSDGVQMGSQQLIEVGERLPVDTLEGHRGYLVKYLVTVRCLTVKCGYDVTVVVYIQEHVGGMMYNSVVGLTGKCSNCGNIVGLSEDTLSKVPLQ